MVVTFRSSAADHDAICLGDLKVSYAGILSYDYALEGFTTSATPFMFPGKSEFTTENC